MSKFSDDGPRGKEPDSVGRPEVQYVLVGVLVCAILFLIVLSVFTTL
jgi:hypothetical protein